MTSEELKKRLDTIKTTDTSQTTQSGFSASREPTLSSLGEELRQNRANARATEQAEIARAQGTDAVTIGKAKYEADKAAYHEYSTPKFMEWLGLGTGGWIGEHRSYEDMPKNREGWGVGIEDRYIKDMDEETLGKFYTLYGTDPDAAITAANKWQENKALTKAAESRADTEKALERLGFHDTWAKDTAKTAAGIGSMAFTPIDLAITGADYMAGGAHFSQDVRTGNTTPFTTMASQFREDVANDIRGGKSAENATFWDKALTTLYDVGYSAAQSALIMGTFGGAGLALFGTSAAASTLQESLAKGDSDDVAAGKAIASAIIEALTETISLEKVLKPANSKSTKELVKNVLKAMGAEASEEVLSDVSNYVVDILLSGDNSEFAVAKANILKDGKVKSDAEASWKALEQKLPDVAYSGLTGALSGGLMAGFGTAASKIGVHAKAQSDVLAAKKYGNYTDFLQLINESKYMEGETPLTEDTPVEDVVKKYAGFSEFMEKDAIRTRLEELGIPGDMSDLAVEGIFNEGNEFQTTRDQRKAMEELGDIARQVIDEYETGKARQGEVGWVDNFRAAQYAFSTPAEQAPEGITAEGVNANAEIRANETRKAAETARLAQEEEERSFRKETLKDIADEAGIDVESVISQHTDISTARYAKALETAYRYGETGISLEKVASVTGLSTQGAISDFYDAGLKKYVEDSRARKATKRVETSGKVHFATSAELKKYNKKGTSFTPVNVEALKKDAPKWAAVQFLAKFVAPRIRRKIVFFDGGKSTNGWRTSDSIFINVNGKMTGGKEGDVLGIFMHEFGHDLRADNPEMFNELKQIVINEVYKGDAERFDRAVQQRIASRYATVEATGEGKTIDTSQAAEEIICDDLSKIASDEEALKRLFVGHKNLLQKMLDFFKKILDDLRTFIKTYGGDNDYSYFVDTSAMEKMVDVLERYVAQIDESAPTGLATAEEATEQYKNTHEIPSFNLRYEERHRKDITKAYDSGEATIPLQLILDVQARTIEMWNEIGEKLNSEFLRSWNNKDYTNRAFTIFKEQMGYKYAGELASMCKKGVPLFEAIDSIVRDGVYDRLNKKQLGAAEKQLLYDILKSKGFEIPCSICYVEQARRREGDIIHKFLEGDSEGKLGWNAVLSDIESRMAKQGVTYTFPTAPDTIMTQVYSPANTDMDERTQEAFYSAMVDACNEEIDLRNERVRQDKKKKKKTYLDHLQSATPEEVKRVLKGTLTSNLRIFKILFQNVDARFRMLEKHLYSSNTTQHLSYSHNALYSLFNSQGGTSGYKTKQGTVVYAGDILKREWEPADVRSELGLRSQSNSDFQMYTLIDKMQFLADLSAKGYYSHEYTKVPSNVQIFGLSGIKILMSSIARVDTDYHKADGSLDEDAIRENAGLDKNGNPIYDHVEGIDTNFAFMIVADPNYSRNVGLNCIGYSNKHIIALLNDPRVAQVIGFHDKTNNPDKRYRGAKYANNYAGINETKDANGKTRHTDFSKYLEAAEKEGATDVPRRAAQMYLEECKKKHWTPMYNIPGIVDHPNYYKLLCDFTLYDSEGNYAPMQKVALNIPSQVPALDKSGNRVMVDTSDIVESELRGEVTMRESLAEQMPSILDEFVERANASAPQESAQFSMGGIHAKTANKETLRRAEEMEESGIDSETIRKETGWVRDQRFGGIWMFELADTLFDINKVAEIVAQRARDQIKRDIQSGAISDEEAIRQATEARFNYDRFNNSGEGAFTLGDIYQNDELYAAYPFLQDAKIVFTNDLLANASGQYNPGENTIKLRPNLSRDVYADAMIHELQHAIQDYEGWGEFTNPDAEKRKIIKELQERGIPQEIERLRAKRAELESQFSDARESYKSMVSDYLHKHFPSDMKWHELYRGRLEGLAGYIQRYADTIRLSPASKYLESAAAIREEAEKKYKRFKPEIFDQILEQGKQLRELEDELGQTEEDLRKALYEANPQRIENKATQQYMDNPTEIQARDAETRLRYSAEQRRQIRPNVGEGVAPGEEDIRFSQNEGAAPTFYSQMGKVIEQSKANKFDARSLINMLLGKGVKAEEIKWSGISAWLDGRKSVTKEELLEFIRGSMLQIDEEWLRTEEDMGEMSSAEWDKAYQHTYDAAVEIIEDMWRFKELKDKETAIDSIEIEEDYDGTIFTVQAVIDGEEKTILKYNMRERKTRWERYVLPGESDALANYRELLFIMPGSDYTNDAMRRHWERPGVLAHARIEDRWDYPNAPMQPLTGEPAPMLFIEEIQSDWHNAGAKGGYLGQSEGQIGIKKLRKFRESGIPALRAAAQGLSSDELVGMVNAAARDAGLNWNASISDDLFELKDDQGEIVAIAPAVHSSGFLNSIGFELGRRIDEYGKGKTPDAPFKNGKYVEYVLKRLIRLAAEQGYAQIGWTAAEQQIFRWSPDYAEAYRIEYDQDIPKFLNKFGKQWGAKVSQTTLTSEDAETVWTFPITEAMRESVVSEGLPLYSMGEDAKYLELAKQPRKNATELSEMVKKAAASAGYVTEGWHSTLEQFTEFRKPLEGLNGYYYFSSSKGWSRALMREERYAQDLESINTMHVYLKTGKVLDVTSGDGRMNLKTVPQWFEFLESKGIRITNNMRQHRVGNKSPKADSAKIPFYSLIMYDFEPGSEYETAYQQAFIEAGYDSIHMDDAVRGRTYELGDTYVVFSPSQVKSAENVVRDDSGHIIPLSQRFNDEHRDIRYSMRDIDDTEMTSREYLATVTYETIRDEADRDELRRIIDEYRDIDKRKEATWTRIKELTATKRNLESDIDAINKALKDTKARKSKKITALLKRYDTLNEALKGVNAELADVQKELNQLRAQQGKDTQRLHEILTMPRVESVIEAQRKLVREYKELVDSTKATDKAKLEALRAKMSEKLRAEIDRRIEMRKQMMEQYRLRQAQRYYLPRIQKLIGDLSTNVKKAPVPFRGPVYKFLSLLDMRTRDKDGNIRAGQANIDREAFRQTAETLLGTGQGSIADWLNKYNVVLTDEVMSWIEDSRNYLEWMVLNQTETDIRTATADQLKSLYQFARSLDQTLRKLSKSYTDANLNMTSTAEEAIDYARTNWGKRANDRLWIGERGLRWTNAQPVTVLDRLGPAGQRIFKLLAQGGAKKAFNEQTIADFTETWDKESTSKWVEAGAIDVEFTDGDSTFTVPMTPLQMMDMYCTAQDPAGLRHLLVGGFRLDHIVKRGKISTTYENDETRHITEDNIQELIDAMNAYDAEMIPFADKLREFVDTVGSRWGNQVSIARFGYEQFTEESYWPLVTVRSEERGDVTKSRIGKDDVPQHIFDLVNKSFTKERIASADNAIVVKSIFNVFFDHIEGMALYNAYALPILDTARFLRYQTYDENGHPTYVMDKALNDAFGTKIMQTYIEQLLVDINGDRTISPEESFLMTGLRMRNRVAVAYNLRVVVQQPLSLFRAFDIIDPKYVTPFKDVKGTIAEMGEHSGIARTKLQGYYGADVKLSLMEKAIGTGPDLKNKVYDVTSKVTEVGMLGAEAADNITWATLWNACKNWVKATDPTLEGNAFYKEVDARFSDIIYRTQVVDSVLQKSEMMRRKTPLARFLSSFKGEPTTSYNMLLRQYDKVVAARQSGRKISGTDVKSMLRTFTAWGVQAAVLALVTALADAWRDDDDYETAFEKITDALFGEYKPGMSFIDRLKEFSKSNVFDAYNFLELPLISDALSLLQGYTPDRVDLMLVQQLIDAAGGIAKFIGNPSVKNTYKLLGSVSVLSGLPFQNVAREVIAIWNNTMGALYPEMKLQTSPESATSGYEALYTAMKNGEQARALLLVDEIMGNVGDAKKAYQGVTTQIRKAFERGDVTEQEAYEYMMAIRDYFGYSPNTDVHKQIEGWKK